ncbi:MAG TPA: hypothetical protein VFA03_08600 [Acetobacteraceae bacterium]|nr:hypothetical protein [Acetobacteraceae bacterium]
MPVSPLQPAHLAMAAVRAPFALFWGPTCLIRRTAESFFWGPAPPPCPRPIMLHVYKIACEPPCYGGCGCGCGAPHG